MIKKTINYKNIFTGMPESKTEYFGLNTHEWNALMIDEKFMQGLRGLDSMPKNADDIRGLDDVESTVHSKVVRSLLAIDTLITRAYGRRMEDALVKTDEYRAIFEGNGEMIALTQELFLKPEDLQQFILGVVPEEIRKDLEKNNDPLTRIQSTTSISDPDYQAYLKAKNENN